jgi:hypothetical protein
MDWIVRIANQDYRTQSVEELRQWYRGGRIGPDALVFHPTLQRWMHPHQLDELRVSPAEQPGTPPRQKPSALKTLLIAVGVLFGIVTLALILTALMTGTKEEESVESKSAANRQRIRATLLTDAKKKLDVFGPTSSNKEVAQACSEVLRLDEKSFTAEERTRCANAHVVFARQAMKDENVVEARAALNAAVAEGADAEDVQPLATKLTAAEERNRRKAAAEARVAAEQAARQKAGNERAARKAYGELLRNRFLDQGLDIKVHIEGKNADRVTLSFALFNDVWAHPIQKDGLLQELKDMGFKRVELTDNYDYSVFWDFREK